MMFRRPRQTKDEVEIPDIPIKMGRLFAYLKPYLPRLIFAILATLASAALSLVFPSILGSVVDTVLKQGNRELLNQITIGLLIVFFLRSVTSLIETYNLNYIGERLVVDLREQVFRHLQTLSLGFFVQRRVGELTSRLSSDVTAIRGALTSNINILIQQSATMLGAVIVMLILNWRLSLFILVLTPIIIASGMAFGLWMRRVSTQIQDRLAQANVVTEEVFQNIREVKSFVREPYEIQRYNRTLSDTFQAALRLLRIRSIFGPLMAFLGFASLALILWFGGIEVLEGRLSGGQLIGFLIYGITVATALGSLVSVYSSIQEALGATKRLFQILDTPATIQDPPNATNLAKVEGRLTLEGVSFYYDERQAVLQDISLDILPGEVVALVGPSGAGKSTLFNLIPRFYDPTSGAVKLDGHDLKTLAQANLRSNIGIVPQETLLFGGTIRDNILYGKLDASEDDIIAAAKSANAHEFISELPDGYQTLVGERGIRLSGGQRQRIAIARVILKNPRIILLDEATSSLDSQSEHLVQDAIAHLMQNRTTIIIAHRLSTVKVAHRIAVLDKGHIVELGTHDELMGRNGLYARLYNMQFHDDTGNADPERLTS